MKLEVLFWSLAFGCACGAAAEATYTGQLTSCVERSRTREESRACRAEVDRRWCVVDGSPGQCDGGAR